MKTIILSLLLCSGFVWAQNDITFSLKDDLSLHSSTLHFVVPPGHHFNKQAPNRAQALIAGQWQPADKVEIKNDKAEAVWSQAFDPCLGVRAELFVCDDKNTYCLPRALSFTCDGKAAKGAPWEVKAENTTPPEKSVEASEESAFILNDSDQALKLAKEQHKPLLIDFFGIWCPPCNALDETVFNTKEFAKSQTKFVLLKLDADSPKSWSLKSKFKITGYPTIIFATAEGDEISRIIGARPKNEFVADMEKAYLNRDNGFEVKKVKAEENLSVAYELGLQYLDREEYFLAHYYLLRAARHWGIADIKRNKLMSSVLGIHSKGETVEDKKIYVKLLEHALGWYPRQLEVFERTEKLADVASEVGDKEAIREAKDIQIETALWFLSHPKALKGSDMVRGDLYEILGKSYEEIDEKQKSLDAYAAGAKEYLAEIKKSGLDENAERGFNLERIFCLWRSGQVDEAQKLYVKFETLFPNEFTFYYQHGKLLKELKLYKEAAGVSQKAYDLSYGDNHLRVTALLAEVLQAQKEKKKALQVLDKTIEHAELPEDKSIRSHKYYDKLVELRKQIKAT